MNTLYVVNDAQRIIFIQEMQGQLSDGMWENSRPYGHWHPWCDADVKVAKDGKVGRTFWADKDNYNFASSELLSVVGDRIINKVKASMLGFSEEVIERMPDDLADYEDHVRYAERDGDTYWTEKLEYLNAHGINAATMKAIQEWDGYTRKNLIADCKALKVAARTRLY